MSDLSDALKILRDQAKRDPINYAIMPTIGAIILFVLWEKGWLSWTVIKAIVFHDL